MADSRDRRVDPRHTVKTPAKLVAGGQELGAVEINDVSKGGVFVAHASPHLKERSRVTLQMVISNERFDLSGEVVHVLSPEQAGGGRTPGYGIQLIDPPADVVARVTAAQEAASVGLKPHVAPRSDSRPRTSDPSGAPSGPSRKAT
jgi:hypothetical protein